MKLALPDLGQLAARRLRPGAVARGHDPAAADPEPRQRRSRRRAQRAPGRCRGAAGPLHQRPERRLRLADAGATIDVQHTDKGCSRIRKAKALQLLGLGAAAVQVMCDDREVGAAMARANTPCERQREAQLAATSSRPRRWRPATAGLLFAWPWSSPCCSRPRLTGAACCAGWAWAEAAFSIIAALIGGWFVAPAICLHLHEIETVSRVGLVFWRAVPLLIAGLLKITFAKLAQGATP